MIFTNRTECPEGSVGKLILCRDGDTISLYGKMTQDVYAKILPGVNFGVDVLLSVIEMRVGEHKDIDHTGIVLGGTQAQFSDEELRLYGYSTKFGGIHPEVVRMCVESDGISVKADELQLGWGGTFNPSLPSIEQYLAHGGVRG